MNRRQFLKTAALTFLAFAGRALAAPLAAAEKFFHEPPWRRKKPYWGYAVDITKCIGCGRCADACKTENEIPREPFYFRTWVERYILRRSGEVAVDSPNGGIDGYPPPRDPESIAQSFFVPKLCNHCEHSPCEQVCPVGATFKTEDGVVLVDRKYCIGCRYCIQACPYGCRYFHPTLQVADKCTLCYHRIKNGKRPACVENCPTGARMFGDLSDPEGALTKFRESERTQVLKPHMGTEPKLVYKGLDKEVR
ncbi:MAG: 4Fe-4S ferredoxin [Elusimicrobia bacterium GWA2_69_24]|nr:MAG: 4Fe-4S ferredoxin [Elusimicrobia bacterium GWA2_69_24]